MLTSIFSDNYKRFFSYLRLSVTDACNFKCKYCLPYGNKLYSKSHLSLFEINNLISAFSEIGVSKIRLTGGEPTIRKDFLAIGNVISKFSNIKSLVFTTNGYRLISIAKSVYNIGFTGVNVSLDTLNKHKFFLVTGRNYFNEVLNGIYLSLGLGLIVKINIVLSNFFTFFDFENFYSLLKYKNLFIRFIDQMETNSIKRNCYEYVNSVYLIKFLKSNGWKKVESDSNLSGPAIIYTNDNFLGKIGIINPYDDGFCFNCNRLRVSSFGELFLCLFESSGYSIRHFLNSVNKQKKLINFLFDKIKFKNRSHFLHDKNFGFLNSFSSIGG